RVARAAPRPHAWWIERLRAICAPLLVSTRLPPSLASLANTPFGKERRTTRRVGSQVCDSACAVHRSIRVVFASYEVAGTAGFSSVFRVDPCGRRPCFAARSFASTSSGSSKPTRLTSPDHPAWNIGVPRARPLSNAFFHRLTLGERRHI